MARIIHAQSGQHLPGKFLAKDVEQARDRLLALKVDWTLAPADLFEQLKKKFTFQGFNWAHFQVWHIAKHGAPHQWKTFREYAAKERKVLLAHQATTFALAAQFIN